MKTKYLCARCGLRPALVANAMCPRCQSETKRQQRKPNTPQAKSARCFYCDKPDGEYTSYVIPTNRGGDGRPENQVPACRRCSMSKADRLPSEWRPRDKKAVALERQLRMTLKVYARVRGGRQVGGWTQEQHIEAAAQLSQFLIGANDLHNVACKAFRTSGREATSALKLLRAVKWAQSVFDVAWQRSWPKLPSPYETPLSK